jgi:hypothetical protein
MILPVLFLMKFLFIALDITAKDRAVGMNGKMVVGLKIPCRCTNGNDD